MAFTKIVGAGIQTTTDATVRNFQATGVLTATSLYGDASNLTGIPAGLGTALSQTQTSPLNKIYYTNQILSIGSTVTVSPPASAVVAYTQYADIVVEQDVDLIIDDGDEFIPDVLGLSTTTGATLSGVGGRVRADQFTNKAGTGAPTFTRGLQVTGVVTATSFSGDGSALTGIAATTNIRTNSLTISGLTTATGGIQVGATTSVTVGDTFIRRGAVGLGTTDTTGRNVGVGTAIGTIIYNATTNCLDVYTGSSSGWKSLSLVNSATGGTVTAAGITPGNGYRYHVFTSPGTFTLVSPSIPVEYLVVGGGGGGGTGTGGGGGAGGVRYGTTIITSPQTITVGVGATAKTNGNASGDGVPSSFGSIIATGGGRGASGSSSGVVNAASPGGSGGGGMSYPTGSSPAAGTGNAGSFNPVEGYAGGAGPGSAGGGGGGGAGGVGATAPGGVGGPGVSYAAFAYPLIQPEIPSPIQPTFGPAVGPTGLYGGGGGGAPGASGGPGGGGSSNPSQDGNPGVKYTGGGGGANWGYTVGYTGGGGGDGIVIVRYLV